MKKKVVPELDSNPVPPVPQLVSPVLYPVSYGKVLIGLHILVRLLLNKTKIDRNSKTKVKIKNPEIFFLSYGILYVYM